jgi:hypothetical protein
LKYNRKEDLEKYIEMIRENFEIVLNGTKYFIFNQELYDQDES